MLQSAHFGWLKTAFQSLQYHSMYSTVDVILGITHPDHFLCKYHELCCRQMGQVGGGVCQANWLQVKT